MHKRLDRHGTRLIFSGVHAQPMTVLAKSGAHERLGLDNVRSSFREAVVRAWEIHDELEPLESESRKLDAPRTT